MKKIWSSPKIIVLNIKRETKSGMPGTYEHGNHQS